MQRIPFPYDPYEGQVFYEPSREKTWKFTQGQWVDITYKQLTHDN